MHFLSIHNLNGHDVSQWYVELQSTSTYDNLRKPTSIRNLFMHMILTQTYVMRELFFGIRVLDQVWQSSTYGINSMSLTSVSGYHSVTSSRDSLGGWEGGGGNAIHCSLYLVCIRFRCKIFPAIPRHSKAKYATSEIMSYSKVIPPPQMKRKEQSYFVFFFFP